MPITPGTLVIAKRNSAIFVAGEYGVCYETYILRKQPSYGFIFEYGGYDGFSQEDINLFLELTDITLKSINTYTFENIAMLEKDFQNGRFSEALNIRAVTRA